MKALSRFFLRPFLPVILVTLGVAAFALVSIDDDVIENFQSTYACHPAVIFDPSSAAEVEGAVKFAIAEGKTVMTGNRQFASQIDAACADNDQVQVTLKNMADLIVLDVENKTITVEAGMRFNTLNDIIRPHRLAVNMVTESGTFTIGGMLGSGTHGSTLTKPSNMLADYVIGLKIVDGYGETRALSGSELDAARVNLGVLGIVTEVTIQLEDAYKVRAEVQGYSSDDSLEDIILDIARNNYSANVAWFPGIGKYATTTYHEVPFETVGNAYNAQADVSNFEEFFFDLLFNLLHEVPGSWLQCLAADIRFDTRSSSYFRDLDTNRVMADPVGFSDKMQYFTCRADGSCVWDKLPIALQEIAIPLEQLPAWIEDVKSLLAEHKKTCFPLNGIYFRFGKASSSYLGMSAGQDTAYLGIEYTLRKRGEKVPKNYFVNLEIEQMSIRKYNGRPHWGKNSVAIFENAASKYPKWAEFLAVKSMLDPSNIFVNTWWKRLTGEKSLSDYLSPQCNSRGECYCQEDSHCEPRESCVDGKFYTYAKICL